MKPTTDNKKSLSLKDLMRAKKVLSAAPVDQITCQELKRSILANQEFNQFIIDELSKGDH